MKSGNPYLYGFPDLYTLPTVKDRNTAKYNARNK
jgi:hypothetical protein